MLFFLNIYLKGNNVSSCILFILTFLPLMDLKVTIEAWGGFKTFDVICYYCLFFLLKDFISIDLKNHTNFYFVLFVLLTIIILIGGLSSEFPQHTYLNVLKILPVFIFARFYVKECFIDPYFFRKTINALKISYAFALGFLLIQWVVGLKFTFYPELGPNTFDAATGAIRYPGVFYDSQASGQFLAMGSFIFLYNDEGASKRNLALNYLAFAIAIVGIVLAGSRAAFGGFAIGLIVVFFMAARQYRVYGLILIILAGLAYSFLSTKTVLFARAGNVSEDYLFRKSIWQKAFDISKEHPYLGIGAENYQQYIKRHAQDQYLEVKEGELLYFDQPENGYLKIMVELGFTGFVIFVLYLLMPLITGIVNNIKGLYDDRVAIFIASLVCFLVEFNTVYSIWDTRILVMVVSMIVIILTYPVTEYAENSSN
ncbi:O-antigen ligase [Mucilaginibacter sp. UYP25]